MPHDLSLITTITAAFGLAMILGVIVARLRMPPLVGYLLAGVMIGPATPGFVADMDLAGQLAEIGVILLMSASACIFRWTTCWRSSASPFPAPSYRLPSPRPWAWG